MLPRKAAALLAQYKTPKQCYEVNPGKFLVGVLNIKTNEITLFPCIQERVWLEANPATGEFIRGWAQERCSITGSLIKGLSINENIEQYKDLPYAPRVLSFINDAHPRMTSHEYLIKLMGEEKHKADYRGFSVIPGNPPQFAWDSTSLNAPLGLPQFKKLKPQYRKIVETTINGWIEPRDKIEFKDDIKPVGISETAREIKTAQYVFLTYEFQRTFINEIFETAIKVIDEKIKVKFDKNSKKLTLGNILDDLQDPKGKTFESLLEKLLTALRYDFIALSRAYFKKIKTDDNAKTNGILENNRELIRYLSNAQGLIQTAILIFGTICQKLGKSVGDGLPLKDKLEILFREPKWDEVSLMLRKQICSR